MSRVVLTVFPPGVSVAQRRALRLWRSWPIWGPVLWLIGEVVLAARGLSSVTSLVIATVTTAAVVVVMASIAAPTRQGVRTMELFTMPGCTTVDVLSRRRDVIDLAAMLIEADARLDHRRITPVEHELVWHDAYRRMTPHSWHAERS